MAAFETEALAFPPRDPVGVFAIRGDSTDPRNAVLA